ncbi:MAG: caspase family protein [Thiomargarita sp.]|nr:caspase family protein [Thiomargarita sp.]
MRHKRLVSLFLLCCFINPVYAEDRALLVGIDNYWYTNSLKGSKQDVSDMKKFIQNVWGYKPCQIRTLTDDKATYQTILDTFDNWLIKGTNPSDRVLFYFSGHGYYIWDDNGDENDGYDETLCPVDTKLNGETMIRDDQIESRLKKLQGRQVMVIIDACHSGSVTRSLQQKKSDPTIKLPIFNKPREMTRSIKAEGFISSTLDIVAYSAVAPNQVALVDTETPYRGVFTTRFIRGIQDKEADANKDQKITYLELLEYLQRESQAYCDRQPQQCTSKKLTPQLEANPEILALDIQTFQPIKTNNVIAQVQSVLQHNNQAQVNIKILPKSKLLLGNSMKIQIQSNHNGYFFLFDINSAGNLTRLFPNQYSIYETKDGYIKASQIITIPNKHYGFEFIARKPVGKGLLVALLVEDKLLKLQELIPAMFKEIHTKDVPIVLLNLRQQLNKTIPEIKGTEVVNRPVQWSIAVIEYEIQGRGLRGYIDNPDVPFPNK